MPIRINKVTKECSVGLQTLVAFLNKKGFTDVEANPNATITDEQYALVQAEFNKDKGLLAQAQKISTARKTKEKKETIVLTEDDEALPLTEIKKPKYVGHINLDSKGNPISEPAKAAPKATPETAPKKPADEERAEDKAPEKTTEQPAAETKPKAAEKADADTKAEPQTDVKADGHDAGTTSQAAQAEAPATKAAPEVKAEAPAAETTAQPAADSRPQEEKTAKKKKGVELEEVDGVFRVKGPTEPPLTLNIKGHIDLDSINQSTRPPRS